MKLSNIDLLEQRQKQLSKLRRKVLPQAKFSPFVFNTIEFFEDNLPYFVQHPFEYQRLVAQLRTKEERQQFLHTIYMYYYVDVLMEMRRKEQQAEEKDVLPSWDGLVQRYFRETQPGKPSNGAVENELDKQAVDEQLVATIVTRFYHGLIKNHDDVYDEMNRIHNTKECFLIEKCLKELSKQTIK